MSEDNKAVAYLNIMNLKYDRGQITPYFFGGLAREADLMIEEIERKCEDFRAFRDYRKNVGYIYLGLFLGLLLTVACLGFAIFYEIYPLLILGILIFFLSVFGMIFAQFSLKKRIFDKMRLYTQISKEIIEYYNRNVFSPFGINAVLFAESSYEQHYNDYHDEGAGGWKKYGMSNSKRNVLWEVWIEFSRTSNSQPFNEEPTINMTVNPMERIGPMTSFISNPYNMSSVKNLSSQPIGSQIPAGGIPIVGTYVKPSSFKNNSNNLEGSFMAVNQPDMSIQRTPKYLKGHFGGSTPSRIHYQASNQNIYLGGYSPSQQY